MSRFSVIVPESTTNFIHNSSFERWSSGLPLDWNQTTPSGAISESVTNMRFGASAMRVVSASATPLGTYQNVSTLTSGSLSTASVYAYVAAGIGRLSIQDSTGVTTFASLDTTGTGWQRLEVPLTLSSTAVRIALLAVGVGADVTFDGVQLEQKGYATTYADGSMKGTTFIGEIHRSASIRKSFGGRKKDIQTGITDGVRIDFSSGFGSVEPVVLSDDYGTLDGSYVGGVRLPPKDLAIGLTVLGNDVEEIQDRRKAIIAAFAPVRVPELQPLYLIHTANGVEKQIAVYPTGGITAPKFGQNNYEQFVPTFIANDPLFKSPYDSAKQLGWSTSITATSILIRDNNDNWYTLPATTNGGINAIAFNPIDPDEIVLGGTFSTFNGVSVSNIAKYRISTGDVTALGTGLGGTVIALAYDVNGDLYAGGTFTTDGSANALRRIGKFANGASSWSIVGSGSGGGFSNLGTFTNALKFDSQRNLFMVGNWTDASSGTVVNKFAKVLAGTNTIIAAATGLTATDIKTVEIGPDDSVYIGGNFTFSGGQYIAKFLTGSTTPIVMAGSTNAMVYKIVYDRKSNLFYIGGNFTAENLTALVLRYIMTWNGVAFTELGNGVDALVDQIVVDPNGNVIIAGNFTKYNGGTTLTQKLLKWNGVYWNQLDMEITSNNTINSMVSTPTGYLALGTFATNTTVKSNAHTTVVNNGNAPTTAQFRVSGPGKLQSIKNETTGQQVDLNYTLQTGEIVYLDFSVGRVVAYSNFYPSILNTVFLTGYSISPFYLAPGNNDIAVFINGTTSATTDARIIYKESYYSAD